MRPCCKRDCVNEPCESRYPCGRRCTPGVKPFRTEEATGTIGLAANSPGSSGCRVAQRELRRNKMRSLSEILLPTDFSPRSVDVAHYAAGVARHFDSGITLIHVLPLLNPVWTAMGNAAVVDEVLERQKEETCHRLNLFLTEVLQGIRVKRLVAEGDPSQVIIEYAASESVGLIMMPTRGCT